MGPSDDDLIAENAALKEQLREARERLTSAHARAPAQLFDAVFHNVPDAMLLANDEGRYVDANRAACKLFGLPKEQLVGRLVSEFADPAYDVKGQWETFTDGTWMTGIFPLKRVDGEVRVLEFGAVTNVLPGQHLSILRDITERDEQSRRTSDLLAWIVESSQEAIISKALTGIITSWNRAAEGLYGYSAAEAIGQNIAMLFTPEQQVEKEEIFQRLRAGQAVERLETTRRRKDGRLVELEISISPIKDRLGRVVGASKIARDLTARKRTEQALERMQEELRQSQKLEAVGKLAGGIAHDFNNLLTVILACCELVAEQPVDDSVREALEDATLAGQRAADLTRQLLAFSRKQRLTPSIVDLNAVIQHIEHMLVRVVGEHIQLRLVTAPNLGLVLVDVGQLEQVVINLVVNARDAMLGGGTLTIATQNIGPGDDVGPRALGEAPGPQVLIIVSDTGVGISPEVRSRIFEPFFTTKELGRGTGLGLSTVFGVVEQSGGHIAVESELGRGTTFKVYLPRVDAAADKTPTEEKALPVDAVGAETVLVVEDEATVRDVVCGALRRAGYKVIEAANGAEAQMAAELFAGTISLLLTDVVMPGMSGPQLSDRLCAARPGMRVLFISGYTDDALARYRIESNAWFLQKPMTPQALLRKVRAVLDS